MAEDNNMLTFGGHLEVLRKMFIRILVVAGVLAVVIFCFKTEVFCWLQVSGISALIAGLKIR